MSAAVYQPVQSSHDQQPYSKSLQDLKLQSILLSELPNEFPPSSADGAPAGVDQTARFAPVPIEGAAPVERSCAVIRLPAGWIWTETMPKSKGGVVPDSVTLFPRDFFGYVLEGSIEFTPGVKHDDPSAQRFVARAGDVIYIPPHHDSKVLEDVVFLRLSTSAKDAAAATATHVDNLTPAAHSHVAELSAQPNDDANTTGGTSMQTFHLGMGPDGIQRSASLLRTEKGGLWSEAPHFGYLLQGKIKVKKAVDESADVREVHTGEAYFIPPGYVIESVDDVFALEITFSDIPALTPHNRTSVPSNTTNNAQSDATNSAVSTTKSSTTSAATATQQKRKPSQYSKSGGSTGLPGLAYFEEEPEILDHVAKVHRDSETRTPIVVFESEGDPFPSVVTLAKQFGCSVWSIQMDTGKNEQNAIDYVDVGIKNGDWVYLQSLTSANIDVLRTIGRTLLTLMPEPKLFPRRHLFRLWLAVPEPFDVNDHLNPIFPMVLLKNVLLARSIQPNIPYLSTTTASARGDGRPELSPARSHNTTTTVDESGQTATTTTEMIVYDDGLSPSHLKTVTRVPAEPHLKDVTMHQHLQRRNQGRDSDSESDMEEPEKKVTGLWFHRAVDFYEKDGGTVTARVHEIIFEAVEHEDLAMIEEIANSGRLNINKVKNPDGMSPLQFAVSRERVQSVKALLGFGADPTIKRESDGSPLLYMCIESMEIVPLLLQHGADIYEKFNGYNLENHPTTQPHVAKLVTEVKAQARNKLQGVS